MKIAVGSIKVSNRIRQDAGDVAELASDIAANGLICPITVTEDKELLAGERRLLAVKSLGWEEVDAHVMSVHDALDKLKIEISENENRKPFTFSEKMRWAGLLKEEYRKTAVANSNAQLKHGKESPSATVVAVGKVSDRVASDIGMGSGRQVERSEYVMQHATPEMIKQLDENQLSVNAAYRQLKAEKERLERCNELYDRMEDESSKQIDELDLANRRLKEEVDRLRNTLATDEHETLKRQILNMQEFSGRVQEEKVKAEMDAKFKEQQLANVKESRRVAEERCRELEAQLVKASEIENGTADDLLRLTQCCDIAYDIFAKYAEYSEDDYKDWSRAQISQAIMSVNAVTSVLATITNSLRGMKIDKEAC